MAAKKRIKIAVHLRSGAIYVLDLFEIPRLNGNEVFLRMIYRFNKLHFIGLWFFLAANLWHWLMRHSTIVSENWVDGIHGLFIGLAIGLMLLGLARGHRPCGPSAT